MAKKSHKEDSRNKEATENLRNPLWRINHLYHIVDKQGQKRIFKLNHAQKILYDNMWYCNIILKSRQLGMSTFVCMLFLDRCLFNHNLSAGIIAHTVEDAQAMFRRIKIAYDSLPDSLKGYIKADNDTAQMLNFSNGSSLRVGTSMRSSTLQLLHVSEFGKISKKYPDKAREIITGSLNTIAVGQYCFIESTAEGREGYFYDMCKKAQADHFKGDKLSPGQFRFHFFPWFCDSSCVVGSVAHISDELHQYFIGLSVQGITLSQEQKNWYALKHAIQADDMKREFPSTPDECWEVSNAGTYYAKYMTQVRIEKRICHVAWEESVPVHTAWDLGYNDSTSIIFFQVVGKEIRIIDYVEGSGESLSHWLGIVKSKPYIYDKHLAPHDIMVHEYTSGMTRQSSARKMGMNLIAVPKVDIIPGIDAARNILNNCWFDAVKCEQLIKCLENYKKMWDDRHGCWQSQPLHDYSSHGADAFRTLATGLHYITNQKSRAEIERDKLNSARDASGLLPGHYLYMPETNNNNAFDGRSQRNF